MLIAAIVGVLSALLNLFSSHYTFHQHGQPITKSLLAPQWMRRLNALVKGAYSDLILVALKLLNAISAFGGGRDRTKLRDSFSWDAKVMFHCIGRYLLLINFLLDAVKAAAYAAEIESVTQIE
jgi:nucleolar pre-ribosomal-associated protein 1